MCVKFRNSIPRANGRKIKFHIETSKCKQYQIPYRNYSSRSMERWCLFSCASPCSQTRSSSSFSADQGFLCKEKLKNTLIPDITPPSPSMSSSLNEQMLTIYLYLYLDPWILNKYNWMIFHNIFPSMRSPTNIVLLSMAVCDLLTIALPAPWWLSSFTCQSISFLVRYFSKWPLTSCDLLALHYVHHHDYPCQSIFEHSYFQKIFFNRKSSLSSSN